LNQHVDFKINNLKLDEYVADPNNLIDGYSYELYAVCIHIGTSMQQGHYTC